MLQTQRYIYFVKRETNVIDEWWYFGIFL